MPAYLSPEQWGAALVPPVSPQRVRVWLADGRIPGAFQVGSGAGASWCIPADAERPERLPAGRPRG